MLNLLKKVFYRKTSIDYKKYIESLNKSKKELLNVSLNENLEYLSEGKIEDFLSYAAVATLKKIVENKEISSPKIKMGFSNDFSIDLSPIETRKSCREYQVSSVQNDIKSCLPDLRKKMKNFENVQTGNYMMIHFPIKGGRVVLKGIGEEFKNTYWWCGKYRNIELYMCGNISNMIRKRELDEGETLWDPSSNRAAFELFHKINEYALEEKESILPKDNLFETLSTLNDGTYNRAANKPDFGWKDIILCCDVIEKSKEAIKIFGSPVLVTSSTMPGYGWYNLDGSDLFDSKFYEYSDGCFTGCWMKKLDPDLNLKRKLKQDLTFDIRNGISMKGDIVNIRDRFYLEEEQWNDFQRRSMELQVQICDKIMGICASENFILSETEEA